MRKYLLLLLFTSISFGQTYSDIFTLIDVNLASGQNITAVKHREVEHALLDYIQANLSQSGDIKAIKCDLTYYTANFEVNGLGKGLRTGWAVCNGNNGTPNIAGKVIVGYGLGYSTFGATGGTKDAVVVAHNHFNGVANGETSTFVYGGTSSGMPGSATFSVAEDNGARTYQGNTSSTGFSETDRNMQPYIVQLYIMKL
jgi:hypothetical protein